MLIKDNEEDIAALLRPITPHDVAALTRATARYHKRRLAAAPHILAALSAR